MGGRVGSAPHLRHCLNPLVRHCLNHRSLWLFVVGSLLKISSQTFQISKGSLGGFLELSVPFPMYVFSKRILGVLGKISIVENIFSALSKKNSSIFFFMTIIERLDMCKIVIYINNCIQYISNLN